MSAIPKHIAIIMDGNGRWAKKKLLPRFVGHQRGVKSVRRVVSHCLKKGGVESLTLFAFSTENWRRPQDEVSQLMKLFLSLLSEEKEIENLIKNNIRLRVIGDRGTLSEKMVAHIERAEALTAKNTGLNLNVATSYGGRWDIVNAVKAWQKAHPDRSISDLTEADLSSYLCLSDQPEPDLMIRTGGEQRISNFMIWQLAYTELYFTDTLWPNFNEKSLDKAIESYADRERRFGKTSEQVTKVAKKVAK